MSSILDVILRAIRDGFASIGRQISDVRTAVAVSDAKLDQIIGFLALDIADHFRFSITIDGKTQTGDSPMAFSMTDSQVAQLSIAPLDKKGKPASLDGVPVWASSDETVVTVLADSTGLNAVLSAVAPGSARVVVTGDADLSPDVTSPITGTLDVTVTAGAAVTISISAAPPTEA
jgi:hypothetical protein